MERAKAASSDDAKAEEFRQGYSLGEWTATREILNAYPLDAVHPDTMKALLDLRAEFGGSVDELLTARSRSDTVPLAETLAFRTATTAISEALDRLEPAFDKIKNI
jgi:hypothetical protein